MPGSAAPVALFALSALAALAGGQDEAPRRPPEPFRVFVHTSDSTDAALTARLDEALPVVRKRVERRRDWFRLAESRERADVVLRIINYREGHPRDHEAKGRTEAMGDCWAMEFHYVDAVVLAGDLRAALSGLDHRCVETGPSLRNAASQLAEELERFCKENYGALSRLRARANPPRSGSRTEH